MVYDHYIVRTPAETSCDIYQKVVRFNGPPQGFASDYGRSNPREDKATIFELWMLRRQLALARIAGTYEAIESLKDGSWNGENTMPRAIIHVKDLEILFYKKDEMV